MLRQKLVEVQEPLLRSFSLSWDHLLENEIPKNPRSQLDLRHNWSGLVHLQVCILDVHAEQTILGVWMGELVRQEECWEESDNV